MDLLASPQIFFPSRGVRIYAAKWNQIASPVLAAGSGKPLVHPTHIAIEQSLKAASPSLFDASGLQLQHECIRVIRWKTPKRPLEQMHIGVNHDGNPFASSTGASKRRMLPPSINSFAFEGRSAPRTFAICDAKLLPPASLP